MCIDDARLAGERGNKWTVAVSDREMDNKKREREGNYQGSEKKIWADVEDGKMEKE